MKSEFPNSPLFNWACQQFLGPCPDLSRFTSRVCSMPGLSDWKPKHDGLLTLVKILGLGMILGRIDDASFHPLLNSVAGTLKEQDRPNNDDEAELVAAAIFHPWCDCVTYVQKNNRQRSPDLVAIVGKYTVEIEVTTGQRKDEQDKRVQIASDLEAKLCALPLKKHIFVHFLDSLNEDEESAIIRAASELSIGQVAEVKDRWHIRISEQDSNGIYSISSEPPSWFPEQPATPASLRGAFSTGNGSIVPTASAQARWSLSTKSYLNPLSKKAERHQGSKTNPFLIALEVTDLPGAEQWYEHGLTGYWPLWSDVSGVLLFRRPALMIGVNVLTVPYILLRNPHSSHALPENWSSGKWDMAIE